MPVQFLQSLQYYSDLFWLSKFGTIQYYTLYFCYQNFGICLWSDPCSLRMNSLLSINDSPFPVGPSSKSDGKKPGALVSLLPCTSTAEYASRNKQWEDKEKQKAVSVFLVNGAGQLDIQMQGNEVQPYFTLFYYRVHREEFCCPWGELSNINMWKSFKPSHLIFRYESGVVVKNAIFLETGCMKKNEDTTSQWGYSCKDFHLVLCSVALQIFTYSPLFFRCGSLFLSFCCWLSTTCLR